MSVDWKLQVSDAPKLHSSLCEIWSRSNLLSVLLLPPTRSIEGALSYIITHLSDISQLAAQTDRLDALLAALAANHSDAATAGDGVRRSDSKGGGVSVQDLTLTTPHGEQTLCKGLSLTLLPGQSLLVVGPSGCGKTSLMRAVAGERCGARGRVLWAAANVF
jgi:ABC-type bacteriocin/lantibiotic exporter with double-glycine peptidase domain